MLNIHRDSLACLLSAAIDMFIANLSNLVNVNAF